MRDPTYRHPFKGRGVCPSCGARRMAATAMHLVEHVLPRAPIRQWVLSVGGFKGTVVRSR